MAPSCQKPRSNRIRESLQQQPEIAGAVVALDFDMMEWLLRFLIGGGLVAVFSLLGDVLRPKGFAGLFAAAPSVALASLVLTGTYESAAVASASAHSMIAGAIALFIYSGLCVYLMAIRRISSAVAATASISLWLVVALGSSVLIPG
jgi:uncharacterized membrane protein (GlpM family)